MGWRRRGKGRGEGAGGGGGREGERRGGVTMKYLGVVLAGGALSWGSWVGDTLYCSFHYCLFSLRRITARGA